MAKSVLAVRLPEELHTAIKKRAKEEGKTLSEVAVELIEDGLLPPEDKAQAMYERHKDIHNALGHMLHMLDGYGEILLKTMITGRDARYYARLAAMYADEVGGPGARLAEIDELCKEDTKNFLRTPLELPID